MRICRVDYYQVKLPFKKAVQTSYGKLTAKYADILVLVNEDGQIGIGELTALPHPDYVEEYLLGERQILQHYLLPWLLAKEWVTLDAFCLEMTKIRGHLMAKAAIEMALFDLAAKLAEKSVAAYLPNAQPSLAVGISLGIEPDLAKLMDQVDQAIAQGYQRIKLKIKPGYDYQALAQIRQAYPEVCLMADANSAYQSQAASLKALDELSLAMIEQPLAVDDFVAHAKLQAQLKTPICLDENVRSLADLQTIVALGSAQVINLKLPRVGGLLAAKKMLNFCQQHDLKVWMGGMYETGVGRAFHLHFAAQTCFDFPTDLASFDHYFVEDIVTKPMQLHAGKISVPTGLGIGVVLDKQKVNKYCYAKQSFKSKK
ncbi:o-succinylbenzoate synthase [Enterococcus columbae]|uniref:o-succinylbenzoate synthase n=1 Tax=Enterococcus columbae DSM 7374 = ATCC 51263 TaxID=1121865 RepID=S1N435_9ENTE|nr:o-succinylbenzoate synthase [Enterococcus columbae]EOT38093.1 O-succinylbenzoate synthase [Enterococcus columbae DSM 7374 = ATCC 51263]EOW83760.1 O-succinylbenzoate synthase [Enterococcus columbae DSM 7374 = ATCC 51263]OJG24823.1 O-succinylbenzoate synthase [Enterococcus columbae DSM 7374 = ATCC 51263]